MTSRYPLKDKPGRTMVVFERAGKVYGHIIKDRTEKEPAKFVFETDKFDSLEELQAEYPPMDDKEQEG